MDKKYQDIHVKMGSQNVITIREVQLVSLAKELSYIKLKYITDKEYTVLIPILPYMEIVIN